jgi:hypothetical protein
MPPNGWPQIQMEEMEIHLARQAFEGSGLAVSAHALTGITARSNTVNIPYPSTYTTAGHYDDQRIKDGQIEQAGEGTESTQIE